MTDNTKTYESKLAKAYKEGHYGESLELLISERSFSQEIMDAIRFSISKRIKTK